MRNVPVHAGSIWYSYPIEPKADPEVDAIIRACRSGAYPEGGVLFMTHMPTPEERKKLNSRLDTLNKSMSYSRTAAIEHVSMMLQGYRDKGVKADEDPIKIVELYCRELELPPAVPTWAIVRACGSIRNGSVEGIHRSLAPGTPAIRDLCNRLTHPIRLEMFTIEKILGGEPWVRQLSDDDRREVSVKLQALAEELRERHGDKPTLAPSIDDLRARFGDKVIDSIPDAKGGPANVATIVKSRKKK